MKRLTFILLFISANSFGQNSIEIQTLEFAKFNQVRASFNIATIDSTSVPFIQFKYQDEEFKQITNIKSFNIVGDSAINWFLVDLKNLKNEIDYGTNQVMFVGHTYTISNRGRKLVLCDLNGGCNYIFYNKIDPLIKFVENCK